MDPKTETEVIRNRTTFSDLWKKEDWLAVWIGVVLIVVAAIAVLSKAFDFSALNFSKWHLWEDVPEKASLIGQMTGVFWIKLIRTFLVLALLFAIGIRLQGEKVSKFLPAFLGLFILSVIVRLVSAEFTFNRYLEWAFWALIIGLLISNTVGVPKWLKPAIRTEFYIKTGLVVMGFSVLFSNIAKFGLYGLGIAWIVTPIVIIFMWWLGTRILKMDNKPLVITLASATSVCGTSAAIATGAAAKAKKEDLSLAISISIIFTILMMVFEPMIIRWTGMSQIMGGSLIGGTVDSTGAVVLAGSALGEEAEQAAVLVKSIQNILIGFIAFFVALFFATKVDRQNGQRVGANEIWYRFPKFIIGFFAASLVASFIFLPVYGSENVGAINKVLDQYKNRAFVLAFTSIGLDTNFRQIIKKMQGGKVLWLYVIGQLFNIALTFLAVWFLLSGKFFPVPELDNYSGKKAETKVVEAPAPANVATPGTTLPADTISADQAQEAITTR
ncbi:MAG: putative sulfate exporter family transporter [Bacteroidales bacterium]|nr:putative sulfate exporter family transporter [Bacteroidales bacterium]